MTYRIPASVRTILLDMNGTFVFGHDRFDPGTDYYSTYLATGGASLDNATLDRVVEEAVARLDELYGDSEHDRRFPSGAAVVAEVAQLLEQRDREQVEEVIAGHEMGEISDVARHALRRLSTRFTLGIVSNLWSASGPTRKFLDARLGEIFATRVFSSDLGINKPAAEIFRHALRAIGVDDPEAVLMVGDDWRRDVEPALELGMQAVWVSDVPSRRPSVPRIRSVVDLA